MRGVEVAVTSVSRPALGAQLGVVAEPAGGEAVADGDQPRALGRVGQLVGQHLGQRQVAEGAVTVVAGQAVAALPQQRGGLWSQVAEAVQPAHPLGPVTAGAAHLGVQEVVGQALGARSVEAELAARAVSASRR